MMRGTMPRPSIPAGTESWLARALEDLARYAGGDFGAMASDRWRLSEGAARSGATVAQLERRVDRGWQPVMQFPPLSGEASWDPPNLASGAAATASVPVPGAVLGQPAVVGFSVALPAGALLTAAVSATNAVTVTLANLSGAPFDLGSGTLRVVVL